MLWKEGRLVQNSEIRKQKLQEPAAAELLASLPDDIAAHVETTFINMLFSGNKVEAMHEYFTGQSKISDIIVRDPGSPEAFYYLYLNEKQAREELTNPIDTYFWECDAGKQIRERMSLMQHRIPRLLHEYFPTKEKILVDNLGSGQGFDMIGALAQDRELAERCHVRNIDLNGAALERGWDMVKEHGLENSFEMVHEDLKKAKRRKADFIVVSGIFCPTSLKDSVTYLKLFKRFLAKGGYCLYNATTLAMINGDPLCDFLMRLGEWSLDYKSVEEIESIAAQAKMKMVESFSDSMGYNHLIIARK